jgi:molybdate transport system substrate-binding protein
MRNLAAVLTTAICGLCLVPGKPAAAGRTLTVFGAASLTEFLQGAKPTFEKAHPGVTVRLNLASSSRCRIQIEEGAPCDVFLSANVQNMEPLVKAKLAADPVVFAHNRVVIIVPKSNAGALHTPGDLAKPGLRLVTCAAQVPIGRYTRVVLDKMDKSGDYGDDFMRQVVDNIVSEEPTVKGIVAKVQLGEADAGICYTSDVTQAVREKVLIIDIPEEVNVVAGYPIAVLTGSREKALAGEFVRFVLSKKGQELLVQNGFIPARREKPEAEPSK